MSDFAVRHGFLTDLKVHHSHSIDLSPSAVSIARELRISVIAIVIGVAAASIIRTVFSSKPNSTSDPNP